MAFVPGTAMAQNLVPNGGFETYNNCPSSLVSMPWSVGYNDFPTAANWTNPVKFSSPDYLHVCASASTGLRLPNSIFGYQQPVSGDAYMGIIAWEGRTNGGQPMLDYREYIQNKLDQPLEAGKQYCLSFYVSPTINEGLNFNFVSLDEIGANLSVSRPVDTQGYTLNLPYHVRSKPGVFLTDTSQWYKISGVYTATGGEEWITIGCFRNNGGFPPYQATWPVPGIPGASFRSYFFIEDVTLREMTPADTSYFVMDTLVCKPTGNQIQLAVAGNGALSQTWNTGATGSALLAQDTGTYWCHSVLECGLQIDSFHIRYKDYLPLELGPDTVNCQGQPVQLTANNIYDSYSWTGGAVTPSIQVAQSGSYVLTVRDACGIQRDTIDVVVQSPTPPPLVRDTVVCQYTLNPQLTASGENLLWYRSEFDTWGNPTQPVIYTNLEGTEVFYVTQTIGHCPSARTPVSVRVKHTPRADIGDYVSICPSSDTLIGREYPEVHYAWSTGDTGCCIRPEVTGTYKLTLSNDCGISVDTIFVEMSSCDECLFMPNAFTPNRDGRNDLFGPVMKCPVFAYRMDIYNRWGQHIFTTTDPYRGWDGNLTRDRADAGNYVYVLEYRSVNTGSRKFVKGSFTLLR